MDASDKSESVTGEAATRRLRTLDEKLRILAETALPGGSVAAVARKHDLNANLLFAWRRLHRLGLLEGQRHAPPMLPVTITTPTLAPTRRARAVTVASDTGATRARTPIAESCIEIVVGEGTRVRLHGDAQRAVLLRLLDWLPRR
ncbi:MAG: transposase [Gemmatimonadaceae bacterium]|nr:transposase [Gemmatimonadaceae bacterium]